MMPQPFSEEKSMYKYTTLLFLFGCQPEQNFYSNGRNYGDPNSTLIRGNTVKDFYYNISPNPVDILIVVDNNCSMTNNQEQLSTNFPILSNELTNLDINYRIGFTTTDPYVDGVLRALPSPQGFTYWVDPWQENKEDLFVYGAKPGVGGNGPESGLNAIWGSTEDANNGINFYRQNSSFYPLVLSDEPDQSKQSVSKFYNWFLNFRPVGNFNFIGTEISEQPKYKKVTEMTGGQLMNIDQPNWNQFLINFANSIEPPTEFRFYLTQVPVHPKKIKIRVCHDINRDGNCSRLYAEPDLNFIYEYNKKNWSYSYDQASNSLVLISPKRELQDFDEVTIKYEAYYDKYVD